MNKNFKKQKGFGLVEIMVVVSIIGILSVVTIIATAPAREKGKRAEYVYQASYDISGLNSCYIFGEDSDKCTRSESTCSDLSWPTGSYATLDASGVYATCAESDASPIGSCNSSATWKEAYDICKDAGARLCTVEETENLLTKGTGCSFDYEPIWTLSPCLDGIYIIPGDVSRTEFNTTEKYCMTDLNATTQSHYTYSGYDGSINVRCCADD